MTFSLDKGILLIALVASVAGKVFAFAMAEPAQKDTRDFLFSALAENGFKEVTMKNVPEEVRVVQRSDCTVVLIDYAPQGTFRPYYEELSRDVGDLRYLYRGSYHQEPPKLRPLLESYVNRELSRIGLYSNRSPIIAIAASEACRHHSSSS